MNYDTIWCNLKDPSRDVEFSELVSAYAQMLVEKERIMDHKIARRKRGCGPEELGEFLTIVLVENLAELDTAFDLVATRAGRTEHLHAAVYSMVTNFRAGHYHDVPDPVRVAHKSNDGSKNS